MVARKTGRLMLPSFMSSPSQSFDQGLRFGDPCGGVYMHVEPSIFQVQSVILLLREAKLALADKTWACWHKAPLQTHLRTPYCPSSGMRGASERNEAPLAINIQLYSSSLSPYESKRAGKEDACRKACEDRHCIWGNPLQPANRNERQTPE